VASATTAVTTAAVATIATAALAHGVNAGAQRIRLSTTRACAIAYTISVALWGAAWRVTKLAFGTTVTAWRKSLRRLTARIASTTATATTAALVTGATICTLGSNATLTISSRRLAGWFGIAARGLRCLFLANSRHHLLARRLCGGCHDFAAGGFAQSAPKHLAAHGEWLSLLTRFRPKAFHQFDFNALIDEALDILHEALFVHADKTDCLSVSAGAARTTNAVDVVLTDVGDLVVHNMRQVVNIDSACGNVGRNQRPNFAALETIERLRACRLAFVSVQGHG